ncbi:MAG TPA: hypothetical protein VN042_05540 [Asticcacaulis sp.]|nr:hypothetical protein [Asticcacaulis sp.]
MTQNDLKSHTPGPLNDAAPDPEIDDTGLPLANRSDGSVTQAAEDIDGLDDNQPDSNNANDVGEDENIVR